MRIVLAVGGVGLIATGAYFVLTTQSPAAIVGLAVWLAGAVIVHDGVFAPAVHIADRLLALGTRRLPGAVVTAVRILFGVGLVLTLVVVPELIAQSRPRANPTILVGDYAVRLVVVWCVLAAAAGAIIAFSVLRIRRTSAPRRSTRA